MAPVSSPAIVNNISQGNNNEPSLSSNNRSPCDTKKQQKYLTNCKSLYSCIHCRTHLANHDELVSRNFMGSQGRAYLFNSVINVSCGQAVRRTLTTGEHAVADIYCTNCHSILGWKYEKAYVETQEYKEGKYIIELFHVVRENHHLEFDKSESLFTRHSSRHRSNTTSCSSALSNSKNNQQVHTRNNQSWSSPSTTSSNLNADEEENFEDLIFPFFDELYSGRSSYPSSLTSSYHNRMRRSLYLDSTPYDWKYYTTSSSSSATSADETLSQDYIQHTTASTTASSTANKRATLSASLESASLSPSSSSSSPTSSSEVNPPKQYRDSDRCEGSRHHYQNKNCNNNNIRQRHNQEAHEYDDDDETQFNFEADKPLGSNSEVAGVSEHFDSAGNLEQQNCDQLDSSNDILVSDSCGSANVSYNIGSRANGDVNNTTSGQQREVVNVTGSSASGSSGNSSSSSGKFHLSSSSISLDDDEFYDCYTDHDVSNCSLALNSLRVNE